MTFRRAMVALVLLIGARPDVAGAHEYWLQPDHYRARQGDTLAVAAFAGTGFRGERKPYPAPRALRFAMVGPRTIDLRAVATNGDMTFARFIAPDPHGVLVAFHSDFTDIELPAREFDTYLKEQGLAGPLAARAKLGAAAGPGRERYGRCAKTWIAPAAGGAEVARVITPLGLPLEVVPLAEPTRDGPLSVRVLFGGAPLAHALVRAWRQSLAAGMRPLDVAARDSVGFSVEAHTDARGVARLALRGDGEWLVSCVHMVPSENRAEADWQSLWASLTFARAARGAR